MGRASLYRQNGRWAKKNNYQFVVRCNVDETNLREANALFVIISTIKF